MNCNALCRPAESSQALRTLARREYCFKVESEDRGRPGRDNSEELETIEGDGGEDGGRGVGGWARGSRISIFQLERRLSAWLALGFVWAAAM